MTRLFLLCFAFLIPHFGVASEGDAETLAVTPAAAPETVEVEDTEASMDTEIEITAEDAAWAKFDIQGRVLVYDTEKDGLGDYDEISGADRDVLKDILTENPEIELIEMNSFGGGVWAAQRLARVIMDFDKDTRVNGTCFSSCTRVFLAGNGRQMTLGSSIGFHRFHWSAGSVESYYDRNADFNNWDTPWEFTSWVYEDAQRETFEDLTYMVSRGVDPEFAIKTKSIPNSDEWYPLRLTLLLAGVLRERQ